MRLSAACGAVVSTLVLVGCAGIDPAPAPVLPTVATAPAPVAGYDWFYHDDADEASLAYGLKESDDLRLGLACRRGAGRLELSATGSTGAREIHLESGGDTERFSAQGEPSQLHDGDFLIAESKADNAVFKRFRQVGWLAQWRDSRREIYVAHADSLPDIERFFTFCG